MPPARFNSGQVSQWGRDRVVPQGLYPAYNDAYFLMGKAAGANNGYNGALNVMHMIPFNVAQTVAIKGIECSVSTAGGGSAVVRMGIYGATDNGLPGSLVVDGGTVSVTTTGIKAVVVNIRLVPGQYFVAMVSQGWTGTRPDYLGNLDAVVTQNIPYGSGFPNIWTTGTVTCVGVTGVSGALPSPAGTLATGNEGRRIPSMALQIAV